MGNIAQIGHKFKAKKKKSFPNLRKIFAKLVFVPENLCKILLSSYRGFGLGRKLDTHADRLTYRSGNSWFYNMQLNALEFSLTFYEIFLTVKKEVPTARKVSAVGYAQRNFMIIPYPRVCLPPASLFWWRFE